MEDATKKKIIKWFWIVVTAPFVVVAFLLLRGRIERAGKAGA